jgi:hypothetical protein
MHLKSTEKIFEVLKEKLQERKHSMFKLIAMSDRVTGKTRDIKFITASALQNRKKGTILRSIKQVINLDKGRGHFIEEMDFSHWDNPVYMILGDNEFESLREDIEGCGTQVIITAKDEYVPEVEHQNRVIKERARSIIQNIPYKNIP